MAKDEWCPLKRGYCIEYDKLAEQNEKMLNMLKRTDKWFHGEFTNSDMVFPEDTRNDLAALIAEIEGEK